MDRCRVCAGLGAKFEIHGFTWLRCDRCGAVQKNISEAEYKALNPTYDPGRYLDTADEAYIRGYLEVPKKVRAILTLSSVRAGAFLDIGCGMGGYLLAARELGFDVLGFEPSVDHGRLATNLLGLPVVHDYFAPGALEGRKFDLIMLSHVIEHIYDPGKFLRGVISCLKPGGELLVVTPNADSFIARTSGRRWVMLKPIDHVTMLGPRCYEYFQLEGVDVRSSTSELSYEFCATLLATARDAVRKRAVARVARPSMLKDPKVETRLFLAAMAVASMPFRLVAMAAGRQACLNTIIRLRA